MHLTVLSNGLRVVVAPRPVGLAALYLWIDAGSGDERPGEHGAAHFLEHMLFKGTPRRGLGEAAATIEALGGDLNAFTTHDVTVLHATVLAPGFATALDVIADMARNAILDPAEIARERDVVLEEIRGYDAMPDELLHDAVAAAAFPGDPYGRPIAGTAAEVAVLPDAALTQFWRREWGADRAVLAVVGEVDPEAVVALAQALLGDWGPAAPRARWPEPPSNVGPTAALVPTNGRRTRLAQLAWRTVPLAHPDAPALDLLALLLGDGPGALIPERLADDELLGDPWASASHRVRGGSLSFGFLPRPPDSAPVFERVVAAVADLAAEGLPADAVDRARAGMISDFVFAAETVDGMAYELAAHTAWYGHPEARTAQRERYAALRAPDLDRALRTWLVPERLILGAHDARLTATATNAALRKGVARRPAAVLRRVDTTLENGLRLMTRPDDGEVVAISVAVRGGLLAVPPELAGLAEAWAGLVTAGADGMSAGRFSACVDATGGMVWGAATRSTFELHGRFPRETAAEGISLALMAVAAPEWDEDVWARQRDELRHDVESLDEDAGAVASRALWKLAWPDHPWSAPAEGTRTSLRRVTVDRVIDLHDRATGGAAAAVAVVGPVPTGRVEHLVRDWLGELPARPRLPRTPPIPAPILGARRKLTARADQAYVAVGGPGVALDDPDRAAVHVLVGLMSAQGGPLFLELRERLGLAYAVGADSVESIGGGLIQAGLATDPERVGAATAALHRAIDALCATPPTGDEVGRTVRALLGARLTSLQQAGTRAGRLARAAAWGRDAEAEPLTAAWQRVTPADVHRVARRLFGPDRSTIVVTPRR
jgi:zinc protease